MPQYKIGESIYTVADDAVENFLSVAEKNNDTPELVEETIQVDPGKKVTPKQQDAGAESVKTASDTASYSGIGSLDYGKQTVNKPKEIAEEQDVDEESYELERTFASINDIPYTRTELEVTADKEGISLSSYINRLQKDRSGKYKVELYRDPEILEEVIVTAEDKNEKRKSERKLFDFINKKALIASTDPKTLNDTRAKAYFGYTKEDVPAGSVLALNDIAQELGEKYTLFKEYLENGTFTVPNYDEDQRITSGAQELIIGNTFEEELAKLPEELQSNLKAYSNEKSSFKTKEEIAAAANLAAAKIEERVAFKDKSIKNLINSNEYKLFMDQLSNIDGQIKMRSIQINDRNANENTIADLNNLIKQRNSLLNSNSDIISDINALNVLEERNFREFNILNNKLKKEFKDISLADVFNGKADLDYRPSLRVLNSLSSTFVNSLLGISELGLDISTSLLPLPLELYTKEQIKPLKDTLVKMQQGLALEQANVPAAKTILDKALDNSGSIALSIFGGAAVGLKAAANSKKIYEAAKLAENITKGSFFVTTAGNEYSQSRLAQENAPIIIGSLESKLDAGNLSNSEIERTKKEIARQKEIQNSPALALGMVALTKGAAEVLFEGLQLKFLGKTLTKDLFDIQLKNISKDLPEFLKSTGKFAIKTGATDQLQEGFTKVSNNGVDNLFETLNYTDGKYKSLIDGIDKDFFAVNAITGGITSAAASAPSIVNKLSNVGRTNADKRIFKELSSQYKELENKLSSTDDLDVISDIKDQQLNIIKRASVYNAELASKLEDLSDTQLDQLFDLYAEEQTLINSAANLSSSDFKYAEGDTKKQFEKINNDLKRISLAKDEIINQYTEDTRGTKPAEFSAEQIFLISQANLGRRTAEFKFGKENVLDLNFKNIKGRPTLEDYKNAINAFDPTLETTKGFNERLNKFVDGSANAGIFPNGKVLINSFAIQAKINLTDPSYTSIDTAAASVASFHEMLHSYSLSKFSDINTDKGREALGKTINEIKENLKNNFEDGSLSEENYDLTLKRIESNTRDLKSDPTVVYEETMNALEEMVRLGYIKRSNLQNNSFNIKNLIDMLRANAFGSLGVAASLDGSTANDIIYHLKSFEQFTSNQKVLSPPTNEEIAELTLSQGEPAYKKRIDELEQKLLSGEIGYDDYDTQMSAIEDEIIAAKQVEIKEPKVKIKAARITDEQQKLNDKVNSLVGEKDADGNYTITQEEWKKRGIEKAYNKIIQGTLIDPLILRGMAGDTIYGKPIEQFIEDVKMGLSDVLLRFNPEVNNSLIGFINSQLGFRKGDVLKKYKKEAGTESIDIEEGEIGALKELESQEDAEFELFKSEQLAEEKEAKKRPSLSNTVKLTDDITSAIDKATIKAISVNIKKFDQEISKNRTITPFIADLKKDLADSLEDSFTSYIRKYGLEDFLKDYREVFLLNMPTSFLSKHPVFRKGILKRVNGKWVEPTKVGKEKYDWVDEKGNKLKIDRDNAIEGRGLTSGPEFIKRNPNITTVLNENEFVDYHFMDGAGRRIAKRNPLSSMARQMASEITFEMIQKDLRESGKLTEAIAERAGLYGLIITENEIADLDKDIDRGLIKLSSGAALWSENDKYNVLGAEFQNLKEFYSAGFDKNNPITVKDAFDKYFSKVLKNSQLLSAEKEKFKKDVIKRVNSYNKVIQEKIINGLEDFTIDLAISKAISFTMDRSLKSYALGAAGLPAKTFSKITKSIPKRVFSFFKLNGQSSEQALINTFTALSSGLLNEQSKGFKNNKELFEFIRDTFINDINNKYPDDKLDVDSLSISSNNVISYKKRKIDYRRDKETPYKAQAARGALKDLADKVLSDKIKFDKLPEEISQRDIQSEINYDLLFDLLSYYKNLYNKSGGKNVTESYIFFNLIKNSLNGLLKGAYNVNYIAYLDGEQLFKPVYEHNPPANTTIKDLARSFFDTKIILEQFQKDFENIFNKTSVIITDKRIDDKLTEAGFQKNIDIISEGRLSSPIIQKTLPNLRIVDIRTGEELSREAMGTLNLSQGESINEISTNAYFNGMLERKKGIPASENISQVTARLEGRGKGRFQVFVPPSAEDFEGLLYFFMGQGQQGNDDRMFFEEKLLIPIAEANYQLNYERQVLKKKYAALIKANKGITKKLREESNYKFYTIDSAVRVYIWDKLKYDIPGLYDKDIIELVKIVESDPALKKFADQMLRFPRRQESWRKPEDNWAAGTLEYDLQQTIDKVGRKRIFAKFIENKKLIFSEANLNKIEAAYGTNFRGALEDMLYRIVNGKSREAGSDRIINTYMNWVRGSVAVTMFLNTRSALLQQLSMVNFTNWEENNPFAQAKAFADTKQWAKDWAMLWNSDWMKERREGLKTDINESELVTALEANKNKPQALLNWLLTKGFSLTKYGDNFAISTGGAAYYRNRVNKYIAEGLNKTEAEKKAFLDFQEIAERTQQSSRQDLLSNQQVSVAGRLFLAFQNTPMQMTRLTKKALLDLVNNRGSKRANISKILYYSTIQNLIFAFFQNALFAIVGLDEEDEEDEKLIDAKTERAINNVLDAILRGSGIGGGVISTIKNVIIQVKKQEDAGWKGDSAYILLEAANVAPPVGIKARRFYGAYKNYKINKNIIDKVPYTNLNHPLYGITGSLTGAAFNVPLDRVISKANNLAEASNSENEAWQRIALFLGYNTWDLGIKDEEIEKIRRIAKEAKKKPSGRSSGRFVGRGTGRRTTNR